MTLPAGCQFSQSDQQWRVQCTFIEGKTCSPYLELMLPLGLQGMQCYSEIFPRFSPMALIDEHLLPENFPFGETTAVNSVPSPNKTCTPFTDIDVKLERTDDHFVLVAQTALVFPETDGRIPGGQASLAVADMNIYKKVLLGTADLDGDRRRDIILKLTDRRDKTTYRVIFNESKHSTTCISDELFSPPKTRGNLWHHASR